MTKVKNSMNMEHSINMSSEHHNSLSLDAKVVSSASPRERRERATGGPTDAAVSNHQGAANSVQDAGIGVLLIQPHPETDIVPCEMHFRAHPGTTDCCVTKIVCVSDARNVELFVDDMYEKTAKGYMLTLKKGKKASMFESEFDLSQHIQGNHKITVKFVTGEMTSLKLQCVIIKVTHCPSNIPSQIKQEFNSQTVDMKNVRKMMNEMGVQPSNGAAKIMSDIELQQKLQSAKLQESLEMAQRLQMANIAMATTDNANSLKRRSVPPGLQSLMQQWAPSPSNDVSQMRSRPMSLPPQQSGSSMNDLIRMFVNENKSRQPISPGIEMAPGSNISDLMSRGGMMRSSKRLDPMARSDVISQMSSRPNSESFSDTMERVLQRTLHTPSEGNDRQKPSTHTSDDSTRCEECGCPGCLNVYDSISTNIYASEQRIMGKLDLKMQDLLHHVDSRFDALYDSLIARQEHFMTTLLSAAAGLPVDAPSNGIKRF